jgi:hypothetical protein
LNIEPIGGESNLDPNITREDFSLLRENKSLFTGNFIENNHYISIGIMTRGFEERYLYSKSSGKSYLFTNNSGNDEDILLRFLRNWPNTSLKNRFVTVVSAHSLATVGTIDLKTGIRTNAITQRPELAHITEDSNPVVILYSFKEGL